MLLQSLEQGNIFPICQKASNVCPTTRACNCFGRCYVTPKRPKDSLLHCLMHAFEAAAALTVLPWPAASGRCSVPAWSRTVTGIQSTPGEPPAARTACIRLMHWLVSAYNRDLRFPATDVWMQACITAIKGAGLTSQLSSTCAMLTTSRTCVHLGSSSIPAMRPSNLPLRAGSQLLYLSPGCLQCAARTLSAPVTPP